MKRRGFFLITIFNYSFGCSRTSGFSSFLSLALRVCVTIPYMIVALSSFPIVSHPPVTEWSSFPFFFSSLEQCTNISHFFSFFGLNFLTLRECLIPYCPKPSHLPDSRVRSYYARPKEWRVSSFCVIPLISLTEDRVLQLKRQSLHPTTNDQRPRCLLFPLLFWPLHKTMERSLWIIFASDGIFSLFLCCESRESVRPQVDTLPLPRFSVSLGLNLPWVLSLLSFHVTSHRRTRSDETYSLAFECENIPRKKHTIRNYYSICKSFISPKRSKFDANRSLFHVLDSLFPSLSVNGTN